MGYPARGIVPPPAPGTPSGANLGGTAGMNVGLPAVEAGPPGTSINTIDQQIFGPQNRSIPMSKQVGPFRNPFTDAQTLDTSQMGSGGFNWLNLLKGGNPYWRTALTAAGILQPTPAETGELPLSLSGARPQHPASTGRMPTAPYRPEDSPSFTAPNPFGAGMPRGTLATPIATMPARPTSKGTMPPVAPVATPTVATPKAPPSVNLGYYTGSMGGPMGSAAGGARNPQYVPYIDPKDPRLYQGT